MDLVLVDGKQVTLGLVLVDGKHVTLDLVAQLRLQVAQLLLQHGQRRHDDGLRPQRAARLHVVVEPADSSMGQRPKTSSSDTVHVAGGIVL